MQDEPKLSWERIYAMDDRWNERDREWKRKKARCENIFTLEFLSELMNNICVAVFGELGREKRSNISATFYSRSMEENENHV